MMPLRLEISTSWIVLTGWKKL